MYFSDRATLGKTLAGGFSKYRGTDAVIVCLKKESLLTCLSMAMELRAWVFPLEYTLVKSNANIQLLLGAVTKQGDFVYNQTEFAPDIEQVSSVDSVQIANAKYQGSNDKEAFSISFDRNCLQDRNVILVADVLTEVLPLAIARRTLEGLRPKSLAIAVGNASPFVADEIRRTADSATVLDVLSGIIFDDNHYFEHTDPYSFTQQANVTEHIATYWH